ncbi:MAG: ribosome recycling factor [Bacteroidia bacterium]
MNQEIQNILNEAKEKMNKAVVHLEAELIKVRAGKANPQMLDGIYIDYYGVNTPLNGVGTINTPDARTLVIQPWEKNMLQPIEKAILASNIGLTPQNDGTIIRINIPPLTEERRKDLVKQAKAHAEHAKVGVRNARKEANDDVKKLQKNGLPEDLAKDAENKIQQITDQFIAKIDEHLAKKEKEIMTV